MPTPKAKFFFKASPSMKTGLIVCLAHKPSHHENHQSLRNPRTMIELLLPQTNPEHKPWINHLGRSVVDPGFLLGIRPDHNGTPPGPEKRKRLA
jgi:hypothetical protein